MNTLLFQVLSAMTALLVFICWIRPQTFWFLRDRDTAHPSLGRQGQYTALLTSTWVLVVLTLNAGDTVPEWLFVGYMVAWAGAQYGSVWLKLKGQGQREEQGAGRPCAGASRPAEPAERETNAGSAPRTESPWNSKYAEGR